MADDNTSPSSGTEMLLYQTEDGQTRIEVRLIGETLWLTQNQMAELFEVDKSGISRHLDNIYETGELGKDLLHRFGTLFSPATILKWHCMLIARKYDGEE